MYIEGVLFCLYLAFSIWLKRCSCTNIPTNLTINTERPVSVSKLSLSTYIRSQSLNSNYVSPLTHKCILLTNDEVASDVKDILTSGKKLIVYDFEINNSSVILNNMDRSVMCRPLHWIRITGHRGKGLLFLDPNFGILSFNILEQEVKYLSVQVQQNPPNCLSQLNETEFENHILELLFNDFRNVSNRKGMQKEANHFMCNIHLLENDGSAIFRYWCCNTNKEGETFCKYLDRDTSLTIFFIMMLILEFLVSFLSPLLYSNIFDYDENNVNEIYTHEFLSQQKVYLNIPVTNKKNSDNSEDNVQQLLVQYKGSKKNQEMKSYVPSMQMTSDISLSINKLHLLQEDFTHFGFWIVFANLPYFTGCGKSSNPKTNISSSKGKTIIILFTDFIIFIIDVLYLVYLFKCENPEMSAMKEFAKERKLQFIHNNSLMKANENDESIFVLCNLAFYVSVLIVVKLIQKFCSVEKDTCKLHDNRSKIKSFCWRILFWIPLFNVLYKIGENKKKTKKTKLSKYIDMIRLYAYVLNTALLLPFALKVFVYTFIGIIFNASLLVNYIPLPLFVVLYTKECFSFVDNNFNDFKKKIINALLDLGEDQVKKFGKEKKGNFAFRLETGYSGDKTNTIKLDKNENDNFYWKVKGLCLFLSKHSSPMIPLDFFFKACTMQKSAPGNLLFKYIKATMESVIIFVFLAIVFVVVMAFGESSELSAYSTFLASLFGGLLPYILKLFFNVHAKPSSDGSRFHFRMCLYDLINDYEHSWPIHNIGKEEKLLDASTSEGSERTPLLS